MAEESRPAPDGVAGVREDPVAGIALGGEAQVLEGLVVLPAGLEGGGQEEMRLGQRGIDLQRAPQDFLRALHVAFLDARAAHVDPSVRRTCEGAAGRAARP